MRYFAQKLERASITQWMIARQLPQHATHATHETTPTTTVSTPPMPSTPARIARHFQVEIHLFENIDISFFFYLINKVQNILITKVLVFLPELMKKTSNNNQINSLFER